MLKIAIIRVHEAPVATEGQQDILFETPLAEWLAEEVRSITLPGFRKRHVRKSLRALRSVEDKIKQETLNL